MWEGERKWSKRLDFEGYRHSRDTFPVTSTLNTLNRQQGTNTCHQESIHGVEIREDELLMSGFKIVLGRNIF